MEDSLHITDRTEICIIRSYRSLKRGFANCMFHISIYMLHLYAYLKHQYYSNFGMEPSHYGGNNDDNDEKCGYDLHSEDTSYFLGKNATSNVLSAELVYNSQMIENTVDITTYLDQITGFQTVKYIVEYIERNISDVYIPTILSQYHIELLSINGDKYIFKQYDIVTDNEENIVKDTSRSVDDATLSMTNNDSNESFITTSSSSSPSTDSPTESTMLHRLHTEHDDIHSPSTDVSSDEVSV